MDEELAKRLSRKCVKNELTGCLIWVGAVGGSASHKYGLINVDGRIKMAHRVSYELHKGPIPEGKKLDHLCWNTRCVNPAHLEPVTSKENSRRSLATKRVHTDCKNGHPLTEDNVYIKERPGGGRPIKECKICRKAQWDAFRERHGLEYMTADEKSSNRSNAVRFTYRGETKTVAEWSRQFGVSRKKLKARIEAGFPEEHIFDPARFGRWGKTGKGDAE